MLRNLITNESPIPRFVGWLLYIMQPVTEQITHCAALFAELLYVLTADTVHATR